MKIYQIGMKYYKGDEPFKYCLVPIPVDKKNDNEAYAKAYSVLKPNHMQILVRMEDVEHEDFFNWDYNVGKWVLKNA